MKHVLMGLAILGLLISPQAQTEGPDEHYVRIYRLIQQADEFNQTGQGPNAIAKYQEAQTTLKILQLAYPNWNTNVVQFRLNYLAKRLNQLNPASPELPAQPVTPSPAAAENPASPPAPVAPPQTSAPARLEESFRLPPPEPARPPPNSHPVAPAAAPADKDHQIRALMEMVGQLGADKAVLEAKVRAGLMNPPAGLNSPELAQAEQRILFLQKENDLLKVSLHQDQDRLARRVDPALLAANQKVLEEVQRQVVVQGQIIQALTQEKQLLQAQLSERGANPPHPALSAENEVLKQQLASLQARLDILEARRIPFTPEELALFKAPEAAVETARPPAAKPGATAAQNRPSEQPIGAGELASEAQRAFAARRYAEAEQKYHQMLKGDENSVHILGNLAATQMEQERLSDAEANLKRALELEPDDAFNLSLWGVLKFRQGQYDAALVALSRSAQLNPDRAETHNYLGITLSQKGLREAAETAFRKAVQLAPNYANAHYNLALIYALQNPPLLSLAKYHYEKALALGHPKNPALERAMDKLQHK